MVRRRQRGDIRDAAHHHQHSRHRQEDRGDQARDEDTEPASGATMRRMKTTIASISQRGAPARHRNERLGIRHQEVREADTWRRAQPSAAIVVRTRAAGPATLELETNGLLDLSLSLLLGMCSLVFFIVFIAMVIYFSLYCCLLSVCLCTYL